MSSYGVLMPMLSRRRRQNDLLVQQAVTPRMLPLKVSWRRPLRCWLYAMVVDSLSHHVKICAR